MMLKTIKILTFALALSVELIMIEESLNYQRKGPTGRVLLTQLMQSPFPSNCKMFLENSFYPFILGNCYDYKLIIAGKLYILNIYCHFVHVDNISCLSGFLLLMEVLL